jgi:integrase
MIDRKKLVDGREVWVYSPRRFKTQHHAGKTRRIVIGPEAQTVLRPFLEKCAPDQHVFRWAIWKPDWKAVNHGERHGWAKLRKKIGQPVGETDYYEQLYRGCRRAQQPYFRPHILRHMKLTELREGGYSLDHVAAIAGHSTILMSQHYAKLNDQRAIEAALATG